MKICFVPSSVMPVGSSNLTISTCVIICPYTQRCLLVVMSSEMPGVMFKDHQGCLFETFKPSDPSHLSPTKNPLIVQLFKAFGENVPSCSGAFNSKSKPRVVVDTTTIKKKSRQAMSRFYCILQFALKSLQVSMRVINRKSAEFPRKRTGYHPSQTKKSYITTYMLVNEQAVQDTLPKSPPDLPA